MLSKVESWTRLSAYQNDEDRRVARIQLAMLAVYWLGCAAAIFLDSVLGDSRLIPFLLPGAALQLPSLFFLIRGKLTASVSLSVGLYIFLITALATFGQGIHDYVVMAYPAAMMFAGLILHRRGLFASTTLVVGAVFWLAAGELNGWFVPRRNFEPDWADVIAAQILIAIAFAAAYWLIFNWERGREQMQRELAERKRAEDALRQSEERIRSLFENAAVGIYRTTPDGRILFANPMAVRALGYDSFEELARRNLEKEGFDPGSDRARFNERMSRDGYVNGLEGIWKRKDGTLIHVRESATVVKDEDGEVLYYDGIFEDVTEQKRMEESLDEAMRELNRFFTVSLDLFCIADMDGYFRRLNPEWQNTLGYSLDELKGKKFLDFVHPNDLNSTLEAVSRLAQGEVILNFENRYRCKDGSYRWIEWRSTPVGNRIYAAARDVTERRRMEEKLKRDEELIRNINNNLISGMVYQVLRFRDGSRKFTYLSDAALRMYGILPQQGIDDPALIYGRIHPDDRQRVFEEEEKANQNLSAFRTETRMINPDGSIRWSSFVSNPILLEDGTTCWDGIELDVTERKRAELENVKLQNAIHQSADAIFITDASGRIEYVNPAFEAITGYGKGEAIGQTPRLLKSGAMNEELYRQMWRTILSGEVFSVEMADKKKDGEIFYFEQTITPIVGADGFIAYFISTGRDVTERKRMQETLERNREMYLLLAENISDAIWIFDVDERRVLYASPSIERMCGYTPEEIMSPEIFETLAPELFGSLRKNMRQRVAAFQEGESVSYVDELQQIRKDGSIAFLELTSALHLNRANGHMEIYGVSRDVSERKKHEKLLSEANEQLRIRVAEVEELQAELREQAIRDPLTGLYNRRYMQDALEREFSRALREDHPLSVIMLDMDDLKSFNDTYGHSAGDEALCAMASCLKSMTRLEDIVCRYGGDEFLVAIAKSTARDALRRVEEWREFLANHPLEIDAERIPVRFTAGIASYPAHGLSMEEIVHYADIALYRAKARGRNCAQIFA